MSASPIGQRLAAAGYGGGGRGREWLGASVLVAALATVFVFSTYDRGQFYRGAEHDNVTDNHLTVATNLSPEHGFAQFYRRYVGDDGEPTYKPYHRFPVLGYALIKLAILPFPNDLSARIFAARMLMWAFFCGAAALAYLALRRLTGRRAVALAATLFAFSSYPLLYHGDMVATEGVVDLFAVLLAFHGVAVYCATARVGQMCAKSCAALFLGWHVYGLLLPLLLVAVPLAVWARDWRGLRHQVLLGALTVLVGIAMLAFNLAREYHGYGGDRPFLELPSTKSAFRRIGFVPHGSDAWGEFLQDQLRRVGEAALPWTLAEPLRGPLRGSWHWVGGALLALAGLAICLPGIRHRAAWSGLALCGLGWALPMRNQVVQHEFEALFFVGTPLVVAALLFAKMWSLAARWARWADLVLAAMVGGAFALFVASSWSMGRVGDDAETRRRERALLADVQAIRHRTQSERLALGERLALWRGPRTVHLPPHPFGPNPGNRLSFLTGRYKVGARTPHDFVIAPDMPRATPRRPPLANSPASRSLTPDNQLLFLYEPAAYQTALTAIRSVYEDYARTNLPALDGKGFRVHQLGNTALLYVGEGERCPPTAASHLPRPAASGTRFFLHALPEDVNDAPPGSGFVNLDFPRRARYFWSRDGRCYALRFLPTYRLAGVYTGEFEGGHERPLWEGRISFGASGAEGKDLAGEHQRIVAGEPAARSVWDVYFLDDLGSGHGAQLGYLKAPCTVADIEAGRFFLHVVPADPGDLPKARRRAGFDNWDFRFLDRGGEAVDGRCLVRTSLPDYRIATVYTGQYDEAGPTWTAEFSPP